MDSLNDSPEACKECIVKSCCVMNIDIDCEELHKFHIKKIERIYENISRFKGLGELNPKQLKVCLLDEKTRHLVPVTYSNDMESLMKIFSSADEKRKLLDK